MYSGSDHIFNINNNFATQIKLSNKPNTKQPYFLLGSRMKVEFRSYNLRQRRGHHPPPSDANKDAKDEVRWGYKILVRPIFSEPQNIILNGLSKQRHQVYKKLGGEESTHKIEQMLNQLVCLTSQLTKEMISVDNFVPIKSPEELISKNSDLLVKDIKKGQVIDKNLKKLVKNQLLKGGIQNANMLMYNAGEEGKLENQDSTEKSNYHNLI
jgi:hypothetical protein